MREYERGFTDALELVASDLEDAKARVKALLGLALEHKMTELKRRLGYVVLRRD